MKPPAENLKVQLRCSLLKYLRLDISEAALMHVMLSLTYLQFHTRALCFLLFDDAAPIVDFQLFPVEWSESDADKHVRHGSSFVTCFGRRPAFETSTSN
jgi:hypothetical protein